jgi:drug/metabolite transporter (DMT)-like permease
MNELASDLRARWLMLMPGVFVIIWSTGFVVAKLASPYAQPFAFLECRYLLSLALFIPWILIRQVPWPQGPSQWMHIGFTGVLMHAGYLGGVWAAVKSGMGSGLASLIVGLQPVLTALWLSFHGGEINPKQWLGMILGFVGLTLVLWHKLQLGNEISWINMPLAVMALLSITVGTLYQKKFVKPCDVRTANSVQLMAAALVTLPLAWLQSWDFELNEQSAFALGWSVLVLTIGGSSLLYLLIQRGAAASVASLMYLVPPCTAILAWILFAETITLTTVIGVVLTAYGVHLAITNSKAV